MEQLNMIMDLMRHAIDAGQTVMIKADDVKVNGDETIITGLEITTEA